MKPIERPKFFDQFDEPEKSDYDRLLDEIRAQMRYAIAKHPRVKVLSFLSGFRAMVRNAINQQPQIGAELIKIINEEVQNEAK
jgi:hypothetical protein